MVMTILATGGCDWTTPKASVAQEQLSARAKLERDRRLKRACGSTETYDRLKAIVFDDVARQRGGGTANLDLLASGSTVRMVAPVAKSRDEALNITMCGGHMVMELSPGTENVFGAARLEADVEYAAQEAADGSGLVYRLQGADSIVQRIATSPLERLGNRADAQFAQNGAVGPARQVLPEPTVQPTPVAEERRAPERTAVVPSRPAAVPPLRPVPTPEPRPAPVREIRPPAPPVQTAARPSFNCRYARSRSEKLVCGDADLARRDRIMSSTFYAALARGDGQTKAALRASRDRFLRFRDRCPDADCIAQSYGDRIAEIRDIERGE